MGFAVERGETSGDAAEDEMTAAVISLAEVRRGLRGAEREPTPEQDEELVRIGAKVLREMALLLLGQPPGREEREP